MIQYKRGNLIDLAEAGEFDIIVHGCNCFNTFGSGLAKEIKARYPEASEIDKCTIKGDRQKLGLYTALFGKQFDIINAYTQYDYGRDRKDRFEYSSFSDVLAKLSKQYPIGKFGFPKIGAGLACGSWDRIESMLIGFSMTITGTVTVCEL